MFSIYSLVPAPWGDDYRFVEGFDTKKDARIALKGLEEANFSFNCYRIIEETRVKPYHGLLKENTELRKELSTNEKEFDKALRISCSEKMDLRRKNWQLEQAFKLQTKESDKLNKAFDNTFLLFLEVIRTYNGHVRLID